MFGKVTEALKKKCFKKYEVDQNILDAFCEMNKAQWRREDATASENGYIWIGMFMVEKWMSWMQPKLVSAKAMEEKYQLKTLVLDWEYNEELEKLYASYGFEFVSLKIGMFKDPIGCLYGIWKAVWAFIFLGGGKNIVKLTYRNRQIGQYIYDTVIRTNNGIYTIEHTRTPLCFKKVWTSYWFLHSLELVAKKYKPSIYSYDDIVYDEGMITQMMHARNVRLVKCGIENVITEIPWSEKPQYWPDLYANVMRAEIEGLSEEGRKAFIERADRDIERQFSGLTGDTREAELIFKNKQEIAVEDIKKIMQLDPNKKTVVIFAHCLSENPHKCSIQLYEDNYTWLVETLKFVREIDNVNWVLKGHPVAAAKYRETGVMEAIYDEYKNENLHWFPNEYNSKLITQIADAIVTIYGTAGREYSCLGIPVVHTGKSNYADFGFTHFPKTIDEYHEILRHMDQIKPLTEEQIQMAKLVFISFNNIRNAKHDAYNDRMKELDAMFYQDLIKQESFEKHTNQTLQEIMDYMKEHDMRETIYYLQGLKL